MSNEWWILLIVFGAAVFWELELIRQEAVKMRSLLSSILIRMPEKSIADDDDI